MSRALDKDTKEALKHGSHVKVYEDLSGLLTFPHGKTSIEIEILGSSHPLQDGFNFLRDKQYAFAVAIPKLRIVQAFIVARQKLFNELENAKKTGNPPSREVMKPTAVMLLMDPEHLTAANARKRVLRQSMLEDDATATKKLFEAELCLIRSLLISHLNRHTKSPTLWSHRRWVISQARTLDAELQTPLTTDLIQEIFISGERHPRNYYAWSHARYLVELQGGDIHGLALQDAVEEVKKWCFKHHDDVSGWMYLLFVLRGLEDERRRFGVEAERTKSEQVFDETVNLAKSFRWRNESVWYFLRNFVSSGLLQERERKVLSTVLEELKKGASSTDGLTLRRTEAWVEQWAASENPQKE